MPSSPIRQWLDSIGLIQYADLFEQNDLDLSALPELNHDLLRELGIASLGHRIELLRAIRERDDSAKEVSKHTIGYAERRQLTVMFCDLVGSTALSEKLDPEDLRTLVRRYQQAAEQVIRRYGGHIAQFLGDGVLVYFGFPQANEDDAQRAVLASLAIPQALTVVNDSIGKTMNTTLSVRIGLHTGPVVVGEMGGNLRTENLAMGVTPNLAARLQGLAEPDQVVISVTTQALVAGQFELAELGAQKLKGIDSEVLAYVVTGHRQVTSRFAASAAKSPMVGRDAELFRLQEYWDRACDGQGGVIVITGEAGIGKSRLTQALIDHVSVSDANAVTLWQCSPHHDSSALYPMTTQISVSADLKSTETASQFARLEHWLKQRYPEYEPAQLSAIAQLLELEDASDAETNGNAMSPEERHAHLFELSQAMIKGSPSEPRLLVVEDAHWSDPTTLKLLDQGLDTFNATSTLVVITARPAFTHGFNGHQSVKRIGMNRLGSEVINAIVHRVAASPVPAEVVARISAHCDGVPLFAEEITRTVLESDALTKTGTGYEVSGELTTLSVPTTLQDSLMARLDRLGTAKSVAQAAACFGREFSNQRLGLIADMPTSELEAALSELVHSELIHPLDTKAQPHFQFKHALVADVAYRSQLRESRTDTHKRIAQSLTTHEPELVNTDPALLAHHHEFGAEPTQAIALWRKAADQSMQGLAFSEALERMKRAQRIISTLQTKDQDTSEIEIQIALLQTLLKTVNQS
jgi:class 3 adenylate cyclase